MKVSAPKPVRFIVAVICGVLMLTMISPTLASAGSPDTPETIYVFDGSSSNTLDVYSWDGATATSVQQLPVGTEDNIQNGGANGNLLDIIGSSCLVVSPGDGFVYSFAIGSDGTLSTTPVSKAFIGTGIRNMTAYSDAVFVAGSAYLFVLSENANCDLSLTNANQGIDLNGIVATSATTVTGYIGAGAAKDPSYLDTYSIDSEGVATQTDSVPGSVYGPSGIAAGDVDNTIELFTGGQSLAGQIQAQGYQASPTQLSPLSGSPQTDTTTLFGDPSAAVTVSSDYNLLIETNPFNGYLASYNLTGSSIAFKAETPMPNSTGDVENMVTTGSTLFASSLQYGHVEACDIAASSVTNCRVIITADPANDELESSVAVLTTSEATPPSATPEAPAAVALPLAGLTVGVVMYFLLRRRRMNARA